MDWFSRSKHILIIILLSVPLIVLGQSGSGCPPGTPANTICIQNPLSSSNILVIIGGIINWIFTISLSVAAIMYVVAGYRFITAAGDPEKIITAKKMVLWVSIGLAIVAASKGIVSLIGLLLGMNIVIP